MMKYLYTRKSLGSLCVFSRVRRRQTCLPPESIKNPIHPNSNRKTKSLSQTKKRPENYIHQTTSFFKSSFAPNPTSSSSSPLLPLNIPFLPATNSSRIFKYTSSTKFFFSDAAASSSRIPRIPGPAQGNVKKDFERWILRARGKKEEERGVNVGGFFWRGGFWRGGRETDLRSGEFDRFGRYLDGDEEFFLLLCCGGGGDISSR